MSRRTIMMAATIGLTGTVALFPRSAHAAGPTQICYDSAAVYGTVEPSSNTDVIFGYSGAFQFTGQYIQDGNHLSYAGFTDWWGQNSSSGYVLVGATNDSGAPVNTEGWMVETWQC